MDWGIEVAPRNWRQDVLRIVSELQTGGGGIQPLAFHGELIDDCKSLAGLAAQIVGSNDNQDHRE